ncbi:hypothetical protein QEH56_23845 [Pelagicoccus enzymogenes]|uniref:hypothetical protein n=1 Tax=Pelagicoccus enzymogenes TaxID=2773457 RepID=UPI00280D83AD|nr:hypothetical protein [Pelagicoccus enzymogenes]MDQ8201219.1 hypothetical protein [Pelagicoccus enzymogenes]
MSTDERRQKFKDLAEKRTTNAIKQIRLIGNLSNKGNYSYDDKDVNKIFTALSREIKAMKEKFQSNGEKSDKIFKL